MRQFDFFVWIVFIKELIFSIIILEVLSISIFKREIIVYFCLNFRINN